MSFKQVHAFLDTGVLLHGLPLDQINWPELLEAEDVVLVIPSTVIQELDKHKDGAEGRHSRNRARAFFAEFRKRYEQEAPNEAGAPVRPRVVLRVIFREPKVFPHPDLDETVPDDRIIASILAFLPGGSDRVLVARDTGILLKARGLGIRPVRLPEELEVSPELDTTERELAARTRELETYKNRLPQLLVEARLGGELLEEGAIVQIRILRPPTKEELVAATLRQLEIRRSNEERSRQRCPATITSPR